MSWLLLLAVSLAFALGFALSFLQMRKRLRERMRTRMEAEVSREIQSLVLAELREGKSRKKIEDNIRAAVRQQAAGDADTDKESKS